MSSQDGRFDEVQGCCLLMFQHVLRRATIIGGLGKNGAAGLSRAPLIVLITRASQTVHDHMQVGLIYCLLLLWIYGFSFLLRFALPAQAANRVAHPLYAGLPGPSAMSCGAERAFS
jgi:hypothetical protein